MTTWFTSDIHFGHHNVINYCNRPYTNTLEMNEDIVKRWNTQVKPNDTVYFLGDFSLNPRYVEQYISRLNGNIHFILGNHDSPFLRPDTKNISKRTNFANKYLKWGVKSIQQEMYITICAPKKGILGLLGFKRKYKVQLCHFPFASKNEKDNSDIRYMSNRPEDVGQLLLHGHSHSYYRKNGRKIDVGFDGDLKLFSERDIIDLIEDPRDYIPSPITQYYKENRERLILKGSKHE